MNEGNMFQTPDEVAKELAQEIRDLKDVLREISRKVGQIETRVKRAFPSAFPPPLTGNAKKQAPKVGDEPTLTPQDALQVYDELVRLARADSRDEVQRRLEAIGLPDLALLCRELGVSLGKKKPSRPTLISGVLGRVSESIMLSSSGLRQRSPDLPSQLPQPDVRPTDSGEPKSPEESGL